MGGGNFDLIGDTIERQFMLNYDYNMGASLSFVLMILIFISLAIMNKFGEEEGGIVV
jgi:spermidine/putrescine transport system permease protein